MLGYWGVQTASHDWIEVFVSEQRAREVFGRISAGILCSDLSEDGPLTYKTEASK